MKADQEQVRNLLSDTVSMLCRNGLAYQDELKIEGLIGITLDNNEVFLVHLNEKFENKAAGRINDELEIEEIEDEPVVFIKSEKMDNPAEPSKQHSNHQKVSMRSERRSGHVAGEKRPSPSESNAPPPVPEPSKQHSNHQKVSMRSERRSGHVAGEKRPLPSESNAPPPVRIKQEIKQEPQGDTEERVPPLHGQDDSFSVQTEYDSRGSPSKTHHGSQSKTNHSSKKSGNIPLMSSILPNLQEQLMGAGMMSPSSQGAAPWPGDVDPSMTAGDSNTQGWTMDDASGSQMSFDSSSAFPQGNPLEPFYLDFSTHAPRRRRSDEAKQFGCTYGGCDKRFHLRKHLYRHQRLKHGADYKVPPKPRYGGMDAIQGNPEMITLEAIRNMMNSSGVSTDKEDTSFSSCNENEGMIRLDSEDDKSLDNLHESSDNSLKIEALHSIMSTSSSTVMEKENTTFNNHRDIDGFGDKNGKFLDKLYERTDDDLDICQQNTSSNLDRDHNLDSLHESPDETVSEGTINVASIL